MKCPKCQTDNPDDSKYCKECATSLTGVEDALPSFTKTLETPVTRLAIGAIFAERYEVLEKLGNGGMGEVYRVRDDKLDEEVALKVIKPEIAACKGTIERFKNELKLARKIAHKHVCKMYDLNEEDEIPYITMEYVEGEDLKSHIRRVGKLTKAEVINIARQVCDGLREAHELGVIHRDMKPQNIMIDKNGRVKIMDFGIARSVEAPGITATGVLIGTPDYISPEQAEGDEADHRSDIYSFGVILFEMVTGGLPFRGNTALSVALKHKAQLPQEPKKLNPDISENLSRLILVCMEKERERRYQTTEALLADLRNIEEGLPLGTKIRPKRDTANRVVEARQAYLHQEWQTAYEGFASAEGVTELEPEDIQRYAEAAWWIGRNNESISLRERAYAAFLTGGKNEAAAYQAIQLAEAFYHRLATAVSSGWAVRAEKLLPSRDEGPAHGYLTRFKAVVAYERDGDPERGLDLAEAVLELGERLGDRNLETLGLQDKGRMLVSMGRIEEGIRLMDEAMVAAVGGELNPETTGRSYCNMLAVCDNIADYRRAGEWVEAAEKWCKSHSESAFPGVCRIYSAEVKWLQGSWKSAAAEVQRAVKELSGFTDAIGAAWYQLGEIELRAGNLEKAEEVFRLAHENGRTPIPGMARLHLIRGDHSAALELLDDALAPGRLGQLSRARLLPTSIEAMIANKDHDKALEAIEELEATAALSRSVALEAAAAQARGALALSTNRTSEAVDDLQTAISKWCHLKMPYEAAGARVLLSQAQKRAGNNAAASLELESARSVFQRLGAAWDLRRLDTFTQGMGDSETGS
jgi:serine/threonine protein kinase